MSVEEPMNDYIDPILVQPGSNEDVGEDLPPVLLPRDDDKKPGFFSKIKVLLSKIFSTSNKRRKSTLESPAGNGVLRAKAKTKKANFFPRLGQKKKTLIPPTTVGRPKDLEHPSELPPSHFEQELPELFNNTRSGVYGNRAMVSVANPSMILPDNYKIKSMLEAQRHGNSGQQKNVSIMSSPEAPPKPAKTPRETPAGLSLESADPENPQISYIRSQDTVNVDTSRTDRSISASNRKSKKKNSSSFVLNNEKKRNAVSAGDESLKGTPVKVSSRKIERKSMLTPHKQPTRVNTANSANSFLSDNVDRLSPETLLHRGQSEKPTVASTTKDRNANSMFSSYGKRAHKHSDASAGRSEISAADLMILESTKKRRKNSRERKQSNSAEGLVLVSRNYAKNNSRANHYTMTRKKKDKRLEVLENGGTSEEFERKLKISDIDKGYETPDTDEL